MKIRITIFILFICAGALLALNIRFDPASPPKLPLIPAYDLALKALGNETNQFYCVGATIVQHFSPDGEWVFSFFSTNGEPRFVTVEFAGKTHIEKIMVR